jgi:cytochrome c-type biogenesis protein CcmH/NrfG
MRPVPRRILARSADIAPSVCGGQAMGWLLVSALFLGGCGEGARSRPEPKTTGEPGDVSATSPSAIAGPAVKALAEFNRGAALMEQYRYPEAARAFESVLKLAPDWVAARFNLGLAYFNMHGMQESEQPKAAQPDYLKKARTAFEGVLHSDPDHQYARFCLGLYYEYAGSDQKALEYFEKVHQNDPLEPYAAYKYASTLLSLGRNAEGTKALEEVISLDPGFVSAVYRLALQYRRDKQPEKAMPLFARFKELKAAELTGGSFTVDKAYGAAGKYSLALGPDNLPLPRVEPSPTRRIIFSPETRRLDAPTRPWKWSAGSISLPGIAVGDVDGDGDLDLCLTGLGRSGETALWLNDGSGGFSAGSTVAVQGVSPCFGDVDNDGDLDLWLGCAGPDLLLENDGKGNFSQGSFSALAGPDVLTNIARLADVDSDGDLDLLAFRIAEGNVPAIGSCTPATCSLYNNNRDGSATDVAATLGLALADRPVAAAVYDDFDNDRDLDLVIFPADGEPLAWVNERAGKFKMLDAAATHLAVRGAVSATSGDPDKDGDRDLLVFTDKQVCLYVNRGNFRFQLDQGFRDRFGWLGGTGGQLADMDNDGDLDIVIADAHRPDGSRGPVLLINDWPRDRFLDAAEVDPGNLLAAIRVKQHASCVVADFTGNGRCDVLLAPTDEQPLLIENVTPGGRWIELDLRGTRPQDRKSRSNNSAIGARVEVKAGMVFQQFVVGVPSGPVAMPPLRIHAGLGDHPQVDWLRIIWPDAVLQAELEIAADRRMTMTEVQRKTSSCPYLFAWDGSRFRFIADFGGVGGLGYLVTPGSYAPPDPTEYLRIPRLEPDRGQYVLQALTPLEEVTYFDEAKLIAVDHPEGTEVYPHEMMATGVPPPPFEIFCFRQPIDPVHAVDHRGVDVTEQIRRIDRRYAGATRPDDRFTGIAEDHFVELDFGDRLKELNKDSRLILFLYGWVEYPYSSTNFAASQAGIRTQAPSIHVLRDGQWVELFREVGYPAGLEHMMTLEVTGKILPTDRRIRISSNMELYWDRIFLAEHLGGETVSMKEVEASSADLHYLGYPREYSPDGRHPNLYDYSNLDTAATWKWMAGGYTRFGEVAPLLQEADDCYVIMGRGEELTLRFPAEAFGPVPQGRRRTFILKTDSYCKDMDLYTAYPDTVGPLPFHAMSGYPYGPHEHYPDTKRTREYRRRYNTRRVQASTGASRALPDERGF